MKNISPLYKFSLKGGGWDEQRQPKRQPSAEIVRVKCAKCRRDCDWVCARATLCGDPACRASEVQARVRFARSARNPLRRSCVSSARNGAIWRLPAQPSGNAGESAICRLRARNPLRRWCVSKHEVKNRAGMNTENAEAATPVLSFQLHRLLRVLKSNCKVTSSELTASYSACNSHCNVASASPAPQILHLLSTRHARSPQRVAGTPAALSSAFRTLDTRDLRRRFLQAADTSHSRLACRALDTHNLRRESRRHPANRTLACISRTPQRSRGPDKWRSRLHFARSTRDLRRGSRGRPAHLTLACISRTLLHVSVG